MALNKQGQASKAITDFQQAVRIQPNYPEAYVNLGAMAFELGRFSEARKAFEKAIELDPRGAAASNARRGLEMLKSKGH